MKYIYLLFVALFLASCGDDVVYQYDLDATSFKVTIISGDWALLTGTDNVWVSSAVAPEIDAHVEGGGFVLFYLLSNGTHSPLPYTFAELDGNVTYQTQLSASYEGGFVNFEFLNLHPTDPRIITPGTFDVKVVVVQGDEDLFSSTNIDLNDYYQVKEAFNPKEIELELNW